ncbi:MAG: hypothetical protein KDK54_01250 [Leptospiraceae bacterium]|nr:hypothetical protein [Leptospiraceae bacterium]
MKKSIVLFILIFSCSITPKYSKNSKPIKKNHSSKQNLDLTVIQKIQKESSKEDPIYTSIATFQSSNEYRMYGVYFTKDQKHLVAISSFRISLFSIPEMQEKEYLEPRNIVDGGFTGFALSEDHSEILAGSSWENRAYLLNWKGKKLRSYSCKIPYAYPEDVAFSSDGKRVLLTCHHFAKGNRYLAIYTKLGKELSFTNAKHSYLEIKDSSMVTYSPKEIVWKKEDQKNETTYRLPYDMKFISIEKEKEVLTMDGKKWIIWKLEDKIRMKNSFVAAKSLFTNEEYQIDPDYRNYGTLSPDGRFLLTGGINGGYIWNRMGVLKMHLDGHSRNVSAVAYSENGKFIITASPDRLILWQKGSPSKEISSDLHSKN